MRLTDRLNIQTSEIAIPFLAFLLKANDSSPVPIYDFNIPNEIKNCMKSLYGRFPTPTCVTTTSDPDVVFPTSSPPLH